MLSPSLEDYLEEIYRLFVNTGEVHTGEIAKRLMVSLPSVSKALQRLDEDGFIIYEPYQAILLTQKGEETGAYFVERNQLLQKFFKIICVECDPVKEAEAVEHYLSPPVILSFRHLVSFLQLEDRYLDFLNFTQLHGADLEK